MGQRHSTAADPNCPRATYSRAEFTSASGTHFWEINNFHLLYRSTEYTENDKKSRIVTSTDFNLEKRDNPGEKLRFTLDMVQSRDSEGKDKLGLFLANEDKEDLTTDILLTLTVPGTKFKHEVWLQHTFTQDRNSVGLPSFFSRHAEQNILDHNRLYVRCYIVVIKKEEDNYDRIKIMRNVVKQVQVKPSMAEDFASSWRAGKQCDIDVVCNEKAIPCISTVLIIRSEVFAAMLSRHDTAEKKTGKILIEDMTHDVATAFIKYLHTDTLDTEDWLPFADMPFKLLQAADKYNVGGLKARCEKVMIDWLCGNQMALQLLIFSLNFNADQLQDACMTYLNMDKKKDFANYEIFKELMRLDPDIAFSLVTKDAK